MIGRVPGFWLALGAIVIFAIGINQLVERRRVVDWARGERKKRTPSARADGVSYPVSLGNRRESSGRVTE
jgi:hypothetical protein